MPDLKVTFKLGSQDVAYLRNMLRQAAEGAKDKSAEEILRAGRELARSVRAAKPPAYVLERVEQLETILGLVEDKDWEAPQPVRRKILTALAYFSNPLDLIADRVPGLGFLDDAIIIELMAADLRQEMRYYGVFRRFRESAEQRPWTGVGRRRLEQDLREKRRELRGRIETAKAKDAERASSAGRGLFRW